MATLDGIRGFVVLSIVVAHIFAVSSWVPAREDLVGLRLSMYFSVDFLFVVSGFVMLLPAVARGSLGSVRSYAMRRVGKLVPSYYVSILVTLAVLPMIPAWYPARDDAAAVVAHLLFLQVPFTWESVGLGSNLLWWSLSTIAAFYLVLPLVAGRYLRHPLLGLLLAISISVAWQLQFGFQDARWAAELPRFLDDFAIGMTAAVVCVAAQRRLPPQRLRLACAWLLVPAGAVLLYLLDVVGDTVARGDARRYEESPLLSLTVATTFAVLLVATAFLPRALQWPFSNRVSRRLGDISFGVFLYHFLIIHVVLTLMGLSLASTAELSPQASWALVGELTLIVVPASLAIAWLSTVLVERPLRARVRRYARRFEGHGASPGLDPPQPGPPAREGLAPRTYTQTGGDS